MFDCAYGYVSFVDGESDCGGGGAVPGRDFHGSLRFSVSLHDRRILPPPRALHRVPHLKARLSDALSVTGPVGCSPPDIGFRTPLLVRYFVAAVRRENPGHDRSR